MAMIRRSRQGRAVTGRISGYPINTARPPFYPARQEDPIAEAIPQEVVPSQPMSRIAPRPSIGGPGGDFDPTTGMAPGQTNITGETPFLGHFAKAGEAGKQAGFSLGGLRKGLEAGYHGLRGLMSFTPPGALLETTQKGIISPLTGPLVDKAKSSIQGMMPSAFPTSPLSGAQAASIDLSDIDIGGAEGYGGDDVGGRGGGGWGDTYGGEGGGYGF